MEHGVTLTELVVTLGLLALVVLGVFGFYVNGVLAARHAEGLAAATGLAQARLENLVGGLLTVSDTQPNMVRLPGYSEKVEASEIAPGLQEIKVTILWSWRGGRRETALTTIVAEPEAP